MFVYVLNQHGKPMMPCRPQRARKLLRGGKARIVRRTPFTIQLKYGSSGYKQEVTAGMDTGSKKLGCAAEGTTVARVLASAWDKIGIDHAFRRHKPQVVFHASAYNIVPLMESNAYAAVKHNVFAAKDVADLSLQQGVL